MKNLTVLAMIFSCLSFTNSPQLKGKETSITNIFRHIYALSSNNDNMVVTLEMDESYNVVYVAVYRASDCVLHTNYGIISGGVGVSEGVLYAANLVIDLGFYGTVTLNGNLTVGLSECDAS